MEQRLIDLEARLAFQEYALQQLNDVIVELRNELDILTQRQQLAEQRLRAMAPTMSDTAEQEPPSPHD